jgi:hypothetical protein
MNIEGITISVNSVQPDTVKATRPSVTENVPDRTGAYLLFIGEYPVYAGRSDSSLMKRLCSHEHLPVATHLTWKVRESAKGAFYLESAWHHQGGGAEDMLNKVHPRAPNGTALMCPFCIDTGRAFRRAADRMKAAV